MSQIEIKAEDSESCPIATRDISVNLKNRQNAIDNGGYGPLNPTQANNQFWKKKADRWHVSISEAKKQKCGNCAAFIRTPRMLDCIDKGLGNEEGNSAWDVINAGELGYCEAFDFKCASARTCDAWIVGGPITEEKGKEQETKSLSASFSSKEQEAIDFITSLDDNEFVALFPNKFSDEANDVKWLFDVSYNFADSLINSRHAGNFGYNEKAAKLRDPKGGLTAAGRKYFKNKEGANLKPGVRGPADTPEKMRRKGSFLVRFFTNPSGPMKDDKGRPTRLALSAAAWGEPVPQTTEAAAKLAAKGRRLLERYRNHKEAQKKKDISDGVEIKATQPTIGSSGARTIGQSNPSGSRQTIGGSGGSPDDNYDPNARDADSDGNIQEGTRFMRATPPQTADSMEREANRSRSRQTNTGSADTQERRAIRAAQQRQQQARAMDAQDVARQQQRRSNQQASGQRDPGSADTQERRAIRDELNALGFDGEAFKKLVDAEARKLKPGQKTNWNPGRLPNGGKIAADGTYIPPEMVREDDKRTRDYYRGLRERANQPGNDMTREGDVKPNRNRDRATPAPPSSNRTREGDVQPDRSRDRATPTTTPPRIFNPLPDKPRTGWLSPYFAGDYAHDPDED